MIASAEQFVGQPLARRLLEGYLRKDRVAGTFLFLGERGLGKTTLATIFARSITCERNKADPKLWFCGECYACRTIATGDQPEYVELRPGSKLYSVEDFESALSTDSGHLDRPQLHPVLLSHRLFVFSEAHLIGNVIGDKLLKVLEEPPAQTVFILDTDKPEMLLPTIRSRGNPIRLTSIAEADLKSHLARCLPGISAAQRDEAITFGGGRFVETVLLAQHPNWVQAIRVLAAAMEKAHRIPEAAASASEYGIETYWMRELQSRDLSFDEAEIMVRSSASSKDGTAENHLKKRKTELGRESLIASYSYAAALLLREGKYSPRMFSALGKLKQRVNQNVDQLLAQVAFENALR